MICLKISRHRHYVNLMCNWTLGCLIAFLFAVAPVVAASQEDLPPGMQRPSHASLRWHRGRIPCPVAGIGAWSRGCYYLDDAELERYEHNPCYPEDNFELGYGIRNTCPQDQK